MSLPVRVQVAWGDVPFTLAPTWVDETARCRTVRTNRGRGDEQETFREGTCELVLDNRTRRFEPEYSGSALYPNVVPNRRLRVQRFTGNELTSNEASFETGVGSWVSVAAQTTLARSTAQAFIGSWSLAMSADGTLSSGGAFALGPFASGTASTGLVVVAGQSVAATVQLRAAVAAASNGTVAMNFYTEAGALVSRVLQTSAVSTSAWTKVSVTGTVPATATRARLEVDFSTASGNLPAGVVGYIDAAQLLLGTSTTWGPGVDPVFDGYIDALVPKYDVDGDATVEVSATDMTKFLARYTAVDPWEYEVAADAPAHWYKFNEPEGAAAIVDYGSSKANATYFTANQPKLGSDPVLLDNGDTSLTIDDSQGRFAFGDLGSALTGDFTACYLLALNDLGDADPTADTLYIHAFGSTTTDGLSVSGDAVSLFGYGGNPGMNVDGYPYLSANVLYNTPGSPSNVTQQTPQAGTNPGRRPDGMPHVVHFRKQGTALAIYIDGVANTATQSSSAGMALRYFNFGADTSNAVQAWRIAGFVIFPTALSSGRIAAHVAAARAPWAAESTGARVQRLLNLAGIPSAFQDIDTGATTTLDRLWESIKGQSGLDLARRAETTELGRLFVSRDGKWTFRNRRTYSTTSLVTFGDGGGAEVPYSDIAQRHSDQAIVNRAIVQRVRGSAQQVDDATSQTSYGIVATSRLNTWYATDFEANDSAAYTVDKSKSPQLRTDELTVLAHRSTTVASAACLLELGDRITVNRRPPGGGTVQSKDTIVEGIAHSIDRRGTWDVTFRLSPADTRAYWTLGTSALGTDTRLSF